MKKKQNSKNTEVQNTKSQQNEDLSNTTVNNPSLVEGDIEVTQVTDTPFQVVGNGENYFVMCGKYRVSQVFDSKEKALEDATIISWNRIMQVFNVITEK